MAPIAKDVYQTPLSICLEIGPKIGILLSNKRSNTWEKNQSQVAILCIGLVPHALLKPIIAFYSHVIIVYLFYMKYYK